MMPAPSQWLPDPLPHDPLQVAETWLRQAFDEQAQPNPNAMTLATVAASGQPSARIVLCKDIVLPEGYLLFFTNYESRKSADFVVLDRNILALADGGRPDEIAKTRVLETWFMGNPVYVSKGGDPNALKRPN